MTTIPAYRQTEIESRQHRFHVTTPAERKASRKRFCEAALIVVLFAAVLACGVYELSSQPGAVPNQTAAPGVLTPENAPVRWQRKYFPPKPVKAKRNPSPASVSQATTVPGAGYANRPRRERVLSERRSDG